MNGFDRRVFNVLWEQRELADLPGLAQRVVLALGLRLTPANLARVMVSMQTIVAEGTVALERERERRGL